VTSNRHDFDANFPASAENRRQHATNFLRVAKAERLPEISAAALLQTVIVDRIDPEISRSGRTHIGRCSPRYIFHRQQSAESACFKVLIASPNLLDFLFLLYILDAGYPTRRNTDGYQEEVQ
jgi:hypothetical protein